MIDLHWLPEDRKQSVRLKALSEAEASPKAWAEAVALANLRMDFVRTNALDRIVRSVFDEGTPVTLGAIPVRLALLGSSTMAHLHGAIRVAGLRRRIWIDIYENAYGQYMQELLDPGSALHAFAPNTVLFAMDAHHLSRGISQRDEQLVVIRCHLENCWRLARQAFRCPIIQQTPLPVHPRLMGLNEQRHLGSPAGFIEALGRELRSWVDSDGVDLLTLDSRAARDGLTLWHSTDLWHRAKQEVTPAAAPMYGDLVGRLLAARQGRSYKALVMDLDNTMWGGVIGDDGIAGIVLGQGSPLGESYTAFQSYVLDLSRRGVILAVCSKNDEVNALEPFDAHPDMTLKRSDIACFFANWTDKAANIKAIAGELNIGADHLVFIDDNPVERALVRQELPMVAVPEVTDDPTSFIHSLEDGGYFESVAITEDDRARTAQYQGNRIRKELSASVTDMETYLRDLEMELFAAPFDQIGLKRVVQLINKTNQFNLTTRRYSDQDVLAIMNDSRAFGLQLRLVDRFGDNGVIAVAIGKLQHDTSLLIDTWLMSCRVLGRQVEVATLNLIAIEGLALGANRLIGEYMATDKNGMVKDHYVQLGFTSIETHNDGPSRFMLSLADFNPRQIPLKVHLDSHI